MVNITIDIAGVIDKIREIVVAIADVRKADKERRANAQLLVYYTLSLHPALDFMRPPSGVLGDMDWYTELRSSWKSGIFRSIGQNLHFKRTALMGEAGTRARIMLLLLWIIGHRLDDDQIYRLLSTAVDDALKSQASTNGMDDLTRLQSVKSVLIDLRSMITSRLPLPPDRNPFVGSDYRKEDEFESLPTKELWGYELPEEERYMFDVRRNPSALLRRIQEKVIIPENKLSLLLIRWAAGNFGLGSKIRSREELDPEAFWNADPPITPPSSESSEDEDQTLDDFIYHDEFTLPPYQDPFRDLPIDGWLHKRYCHVYKIHGWLHNKLARVLLFNAFCATYHLPPRLDIKSAVHVAQRLGRRFPQDVCDYMVPFILASCFFSWADEAEESGSAIKIPFAEWTEEERGMSAIFADVLRWRDDQPITLSLFSPLESIQLFLLNPTHSCSSSPDILSLPLIKGSTTFDLDSKPPVTELIIPTPDPESCTCGECQLSFNHLRNNIDYFRVSYFTITEQASSRGCSALLDALEPRLREAENWFQELEREVGSSFTPFPWRSERRLGPAILEVGRTLKIHVGSGPALSNAELLRFLTTMTTLHDEYPIAMPKRLLPATGLGYVVKVPVTPDREDYCPDGQHTEYAIYAGGNWLYDLADLNGVSLIYSDEDTSIDYTSRTLSRFAPICMAELMADSIHLMPLSHTDENGSTISLLLRSHETETATPHVRYTLSNFRGHGFPLLSVADTESPVGGREAVAALMQVTFLDREIETIWKPEVYVGRECDHKESHGRMTHCAPTATEILLQIHPSQEQADKSQSHFLSWSTLFELERSENMCREALSKLLDQNQRRTAELRKTGSILERNRGCIIRCGARDGPIDPIIVLAASLGKRVYQIHYRQCWECALADMQVRHCTVGLAVDVQVITVCDACGNGDDVGVGG